VVNTDPATPENHIVQLWPALLRVWCSRFVTTYPFKFAPHYQHNYKAQKGGEKHMLWTLFVILLVLWLVGVVSSYTLGGFIHLLLVLALVALIFQLLTGRRTAI
jgi:Flp pilus assembly protein TadB